MRACKVSQLWGLELIKMAGCEIQGLDCPPPSPTEPNRCQEEQCNGFSDRGLGWYCRVVPNAGGDLRCTV